MNGFILPEEAEFVINRLKHRGFEAYAVGGCVRDKIMGREPNDYDITTSALPTEMQSVFADCRLVETGLKHGTVTVVFEKMSIEVTTYRIDGEYTDSRHPEKVTFTPLLSEDLRRRDFTANAIAYSPDEGYVDLFGGQEDIENRIIRAVGNADERFGEDALRILRAVRFSAQLGFEIEKSTSDAVISMYRTLSRISRERINQELTKLITGRYCAEVLKNYSEVIAFSLDETGENINSEIIKHNAETVGRCPEDSDARYAALLLGAENCGKVYSSLKPSRKSQKAVEDYISLLNTDMNDEYSLRKLTGTNGSDFVRNLMGFEKACGIVCEAEYSLEMKKYASLMEKNPVCTVAQLAVGGNDMLTAGISGINIKTALNHLLDMVMKNEIPNEKELLAAEAERFIKNGNA